MQTNKNRFYRYGIIVEIFSIAWMVLEFAVGLIAGVQAHSLLLVAFGLDSLLEIISGGALLWRLIVSTRYAPARIAVVERRAGKIVGWCLLALALYIVLTSVYNLVHHTGADGSLAGTLMSLASLICMPIVMAVKLKIAAKVNSPALREDAMCNLTCAYTAAAVLLGSLLTMLLGWWWTDSAFALLLVYFIVKEGLEGIRG